MSASIFPCGDRRAAARNKFSMSLTTEDETIDDVTFKLLRVSYSETRWLYLQNKYATIKFFLTNKLEIFEKLKFRKYKV